MYLLLINQVNVQSLLLPLRLTGSWAHPCSATLVRAALDAAHVFLFSLLTCRSCLNL